LKLILAGISIFQKLATRLFETLSANECNLEDTIFSLKRVHKASSSTTKIAGADFKFNFLIINILTITKLKYQRIPELH